MKDGILLKIFNQEWVFDKNIVESNIILYGKWTSKPSFMVIFNSNGETNQNSQRVIHGNFILESSTPQKMGFNFQVWYSDSKLNNKWNFHPNTVDSDITLYGKWY